MGLNCVYSREKYILKSFAQELTIDIWGSGTFTNSKLVKIGDDSSPS